ncbi:MAG: TolC family protein [Acidobacteriota bacterium]
MKEARSGRAWRRIGLTVVLLSIPHGRAMASEVWNLAACEREALSMSHRIRAGDYRSQSAHAAAEQADSRRWPSLGVGASYAYTSETMELHLPQFGAFSIPDIRFGDGNVYDVSVVASVPLFTGGALRGRARAERAGYRAARLECAADSLLVTHEVRSAFFQAVGAEAQAEAVRLAEDRLHRHVRELESAIEAGAATEEARIQALAHLRRVEQTRLQADAAVSAARLNLGRLVGRPGEELVPAGNLEASVLDSGTLNGGIVSRPELTALEERTRQSDEMARAARAGYFPAISAQVGYHHAKPGVDAVADEWMQFATAGVVLSWSLWDWGGRGQQVRQARAAGRALEEERALLHDVLESRLAIARSALTSSQDQVHSAEERVRLERRRLELVKGRYAAAAATESERLDAEDDLSEAETDLAAAKARLRLAEVEVLYAVGR